MIDFDHNFTGEHFRQIEDIIDAKKLLGQYNIIKHSPGTNSRYVYSSSTGTDNRFIRYDDDGAHIVNLNVKQTDSEITVVRVKCRETPIKNKQSKWNMHDIAIPGDGCHLGESPSLVNLVTLVGFNVPCEGEEYLVPLSSWDPDLKAEEIRTDLKSYSDCYFDAPSKSKKFKTEDDLDDFTKNVTNRSENDIKNAGINLVFRRPSWTGKFSKFIRKHCKMTKTLEPKI